MTYGRKASVTVSSPHPHSTLKGSLTYSSHSGTVQYKPSGAGLRNLDVLVTNKIRFGPFKKLRLMSVNWVQSAGKLGFICRLFWTLNYVQYNCSYSTTMCVYRNVIMKEYYIEKKVTFSVLLNRLNTTLKTWFVKVVLFAVFLLQFYKCDINNQYPGTVKRHNPIIGSKHTVLSQWDDGLFVSKIHVLHKRVTSLLYQRIDKGKLLLHLIFTIPLWKILEQFKNI